MHKANVMPMVVRCKLDCWAYVKGLFHNDIKGSKTHRGNKADRQEKCNKKIREFINKKCCCASAEEPAISLAQGNIQEKQVSECPRKTLALMQAGGEIFNRYAPQTN